MPDVQTLERLLQTTAVYGLGFVFLSLVSFLLLWVSFRLSAHLIGVVGALREWLPQWFQAQIASHTSVAKSADRLTETMGALQIKTDRLHQAGTHTVKAIHAHVAGRPNEFDKEVSIHLENASAALEGD